MSIEAKLLHLQAIQNVLASFRYLYCVDLEATCDEVGANESLRPLAVVPELNRPGFSRHLASSLRNAFQTLPVTADC